MGTALGLICLLVAYRTLSAAAEPTYDPGSGQLVDGGADLSQPASSTSMAKDLLWACVLLLPLVGATDYGWILASAVPLVAAWQGYQLFLAPMMNMGSGSDGPAPRSEKAEKRAARRRSKMR